jgi:FkbM family methyltransferase
MIPVNALTPTRYGPMVYHRLDTYVGRSLDLYGEFSPDETDFLSRLVGPGSLVLDGGANIGALTVPLARQVGPLGHVWAIEPQRLTYQVLCGNLALNSLTNVTALHGALGKAGGGLTLPALDLTQPQNVGGVSVKGHAEGEKVRTYAIDDLDLPGLTLLKLDVEGMERDALAGARDTIEAYQPILYVENDREEQRDALIADLRAMAYRLYWHRPPLYRRNNFRGNRVNVFEGIVSLNVLALPPHDTREFGLEAV